MENGRVSQLQCVLRVRSNAIFSLTRLTRSDLFDTKKRCFAASAASCAWGLSIFFHTGVAALSAFGLVKLLLLPYVK